MSYFRLFKGEVMTSFLFLLCIPPLIVKRNNNGTGSAQIVKHIKHSATVTVCVEMVRDEQTRHISVTVLFLAKVYRSAASRFPEWEDRKFL